MALNPDPDDFKARLYALDRSITLPGRSHRLGEVLGDAERIYQWLVYGDEDATRLVIRTGPVYGQGTSPAPNSKGVIKMAVTLTDTQQVDLTVTPEDSKGNPTTDANLSWSVDDAAIASVTVDAANPSVATVVAGAPGTTNVNVTDGTLSGVEVVVVTAGAAASLLVGAGTPTEQPPKV